MIKKSILAVLIVISLSAFSQSSGYLCVYDTTVGKFTPVNYLSYYTINFKEVKTLTQLLRLLEFMDIRVMADGEKIKKYRVKKFLKEIKD